MDLKNLTQLELLDLRKKCNDALEEYSNREKIKVFKLSVFGNNYYFSDYKKLLKDFNSYIEDYDFTEMILNDPISISTEYMNQAEFDKWIT